MQNSESEARVRTVLSDMYHAMMAVMIAAPPDNKEANTGHGAGIGASSQTRREPDAETCSSESAVTDSSVLNCSNILQRFSLRRKRRENLPSSRIVVPNHTWDPAKESSVPNAQYANNKIKTTKYTLLTFIPKNLFEQFHRYANLYFIFIVALNWMPAINAFGKEIAMIPVLIVLTFTAVKDAFEDYRRHLSDIQVNQSTCRAFSKNENRYVRTKWQDLRVGDIVHLAFNEKIPADILLLCTSDEQGTCWVETINIDGEGNLKQRHVVKGYAHLCKVFSPLKFISNIECDNPNNQIYKFSGTVMHVKPTGELHKIPLTKENLLLQGCILKNTDFVEGIVVYAGHETKAMLNNSGPRYKRSKLEQYMNRDIIWCVVILLVLCFIGGLGSALWLAQHDKDTELPFLPDSGTRENLAYFGFQIFLTSIIIYQVIIPLSLYVSMEIVKLGQVYFMNMDKEMYHDESNRTLECRALNINEELGQIEHIFCDKTGTLTENKMIFRKCSIAGISFGDTTDRCPKSKGKDSHIELKESADNISQAERSNNEQADVNSILYRSVAEICQASVNRMSDLKVTQRYIQDFLIAMAICNTVVVGKRPRRDTMNASGFILPESEQSTPIFESRFGIFPITKICQRLTSSASIPKGMNDRYSKLSTYSLKTMDYTDKYRFAMESSGFLPYYEAESPDELALVKAASAYGVVLLRRSAEAIRIKLPDETVMDFEILHVLPFDATRKRMSILVRHPYSQKILLYCKGADSAVISDLAASSSVTKSTVDATIEHLDSYAQEGLRTLCVAKRVISDAEYNEWWPTQYEAENAIDKQEDLMLKAACKIETNLLLLGATGIEDRLQEGVPQCIAALREAGIKVWVITGDKRQTAVNIALSCHLFTPDMNILLLSCRTKEATNQLLQSYVDQTAAANSEKFCLVVDGHTLFYAINEENSAMFLNLSQRCKAILCCRATPMQKASVVRLIKENLHVVTLAIGDGANDVTMIHTADVGVGISGQEGMQAVMASDFAIARFHHLQRLLLVHGHWCYDRLARMILYFFYKNASYIFVLFWYQFYCTFSGQVMVDQVYLILYSLLFTALQPLIFGVFDQDAPSELLLAKPQLYKQGSECVIYKRHSFWVNILDAVYQSLVIFFIPVLGISATELGMWELGTLSTTICVCVHTLHLSIETKSWTWPHLVSIALSLIVYIGTIFLTSLICLTCNPPSNPYWVTMHVMARPLHWIILMLTIVVALFPRFMVRVIQTNFFPDMVTQATLETKLKQTSSHDFTASCTYNSFTSQSSLVLSSPETVSTA